MTRYNHCRFCGDWRGEKVKYGTRHYAHFVCYLDAGKPLGNLPAFQLGRFPYRLLEARGLLDQARRLLNEIDRRQTTLDL